MYFHLMRRERWEEYPENLRPAAENIIQNCINFLLVALYEPDPENGCVVDPERLDRLVGDPGPVNFGDLSCTHVERRGKVYVARVSEAAPEAEGLKRYLEESPKVGLAGCGGNRVVGKMKTILRGGKNDQ